jgi:hypothetical protein
MGKTISHIVDGSNIALSKRQICSDLSEYPHVKEEPR